MSTPTWIHATDAELKTERFWLERIDPVARCYGIETPTELHRDPGDPNCHLLKDDDGALVLVVCTGPEAADA